MSKVSFTTSLSWRWSVCGWPRSADLAFDARRGPRCRRTGFAIRSAMMSLRSEETWSVPIYDAES